MTDESLKPEDDELFYFESDHLALKGNLEYSELVKTLFTLEAQRKRAVDDYNKVIQVQKEVEKDPMLMIQKLKSGEGLGVPDMQHIVDVPKINWSKFKINIPDRILAAVNKDEEAVASRLKSDDLKQKNSLNTHSKPWTVEEQKRLEELLVQFPPEAIELRRFKKIAAALGTRNVKQVCSRVQKYFLKLKKAGLPIPGRIPKVFDRKRSHKHQRLNHYLIKPSTFFPHLDIPVVMNEDDEIPGPSQNSKSSESYDSHSSNYLLTSTYHEDNRIGNNKNEVDLQLYILKNIRNEKKLECNENVSLFQHVGFKCDHCEEDPISGSRWHCTTCDPSKSVDFCTDCMLSQMYLDNKHPLTHKFLIVRDEKTIISTDSSSESISGSVVNDSNKDLESSEIDSDDLEDYYIKEELVDNQEMEDDTKEGVLEEDTESWKNNHDYAPIKTESPNNIDNSEIENESYNYLHSNLFLDGT